jgi:hypothetical protein
MQFEELWARYEEVRNALNDVLPHSSDVVETDKQKETREDLERQYNKLTQFVLGHPESFDNVRCWMVDAKGTQSEQCELTPEIVEAINTDAAEELGHKYIEHFGALPTEVRNIMMRWNLTDSGGGCGNWHLGCHCTESEARELCIALHSRFEHAIDMGILTIERKLWSLRLK